MLKIPQISVTNGILEVLPASEYLLVEASLAWVDLVVGSILSSPNESVDYGYFPTDGTYSVMAEDAKGSRSETGIVGREGFLGSAIILFADHAPSQVVVETPGRALKVARDDLQAMLPTCPILLTLLLRYIHVLGVQTEQSALSSGHYSILARVARRLLMTLDRTDSNEFTITHEYLSLTLAVRRAGVTVALGKLETEGIIKSSRGNIQVLKRASLKKVAGGCYGVPEREYNRLMRRD